MTEAGVKVDAQVLTAPLYGVVTDCLRLTMHFFHPIQQCAQQIYHTALPLSPTSSLLRSSCLQSVIDNQLSCVTTFSGIPSTWGLLLRAIDIRSRQLTCIATSMERIITACEEVVDIYDAITFVPQQSLHTPEAVTKIQTSPDGSILFFAHSFSVTMWDVQTGGLIHTFTMRSRINDLVISPLGVHIACGSSDGSVAVWETRTKKQGKGFRNKQPVVAIYWLSPQELAVATQDSIHIHNFRVGKATNISSTTDCVWGMAHLVDQGKLMVGISQPGVEVGQELHSFEMMEPRGRCSTPLPPVAFTGRLSSPVVVGEKIVCIASPSGVQLFNTSSFNWTSGPPLLDAATSVALSLNRNLVVQTKDSVQIFSADVLTSREVRSDVRPSHVYPLGNHIACILQPNRRLTLLESETLREVHPDDSTPPLNSYQLGSTCSPFDHWLVGGFGFSAIMQAWKSSTPLPGWTERDVEDVPVSGLSPKCTKMITVCDSPQWRLRLINPMNGRTLVELNPRLRDDRLGTGQIYDLVFDSETSFYLKVDGPGWHIQIPCEILLWPSGGRSCTLEWGKPEPFLLPRTPPPYTLDANYEWVLDAKSRKVCWISPGNIRRGYGGHFWAGLSLVMVGDDGVVRKLTFKEPDC